MKLLQLLTVILALGLSQATLATDLEHEPGAPAASITVSPAPVPAAKPSPQVRCEGAIELFAKGNYTGSGRGDEGENAYQREPLATQYDNVEEGAVAARTESCSDITSDYAATCVEAFTKIYVSGTLKITKLISEEEMAYCAGVSTPEASKCIDNYPGLSFPSGTSEESFLEAAAANSLREQASLEDVQNSCGQE